MCQKPIYGLLVACTEQTSMHACPRTLPRLSQQLVFLVATGQTVCRIKGEEGWKAASHLLHPNDSHASAHGVWRKVVAPGIKADLEEKQTGTKSCRFMGKPGTPDWNWKSTLEQESERAARGRNKTRKGQDNSQGQEVGGRIQSNPLRQPVYKSVLYAKAPSQPRTSSWSPDSQRRDWGTLEGLHGEEPYIWALQLMAVCHIQVTKEQVSYCHQVATSTGP